MKITWLSHAAFLIEGNDRVLIDPFLTNNPLAQVGPDDVECDIVAVTHGHGDHLGDAIAIAKRTGAAFVCSLKNYRARSALYETARAFGLPPAEARSMSKRIPMFEEPEYLKKDRPLPGCGEIWSAASELTSVYCEISLHVGGVLLTPAPTRSYLPLEESAKGLRMSHFDRDAVEDLKLIKLDLLSVRGLAAISGTRKALDIRVFRTPMP